jgi:hypothetical protein
MARASNEIEDSLDAIAAGVKRGARPVLERYRAQGRTLPTGATISSVVEQMVAVLPEPSDWNEVVGPFYRTNAVAKLLGGVSRQALEERRRRRTILALPTADGAWAYPTFQFAGAHVVPGLVEVIQTFDPDAVDAWTLASWLCARRRALGGRSIVAWLREGRAPARVLALARDAARRFAR